jgi:hypothetical protein
MSDEARVHRLDSLDMSLVDLPHFFVYIRRGALLVQGHKLEQKLSHIGTFVASCLLTQLGPSRVRSGHVSRPRAIFA